MSNTIYIKTEDFSKLNWEIIKTYPNKHILQTNKGRVYLVDETCVLKAQQLTEDEKRWYMGLEKWEQYQKEDIIKLSIKTVETDLPKDMLVGLRGNLYSELTQLSKETGYIEGQNLGSVSLLFRKEKFANVIKIVTKIGFKVEPVKSTFTFNELAEKYPSSHFYVCLKKIDSIQDDFSVITKTYIVVYEQSGKKSSSGRDIYLDYVRYFVKENSVEYRSVPNPYLK